MVTVIARATWGARYADGGGSAPLPAREVWLHHSVTAAPANDPGAEHAAMRTLETIGQQRFGQGISYTFGLPPSGRIYEGHSVNRLGAHTGGRNSIARAIVLIGNYDTGAVSPAQVESAAQLLAHGYRAGWWTAARLNGGHQQAPGASTACPGRHGMAVIGQINARAAAILGGAPPIEEDDVSWNDPIAYGVAQYTGSPQPAHMVLGDIFARSQDNTAALKRVEAALAAERVATDKLIALASDKNETFDAEEFRRVLREEMANVVDVQVTVRDGGDTPAA